MSMQFVRWTNWKRPSIRHDLLRAPRAESCESLFRYPQRHRRTLSEAAPGVAADYSRGGATSHGRHSQSPMQMRSERDKSWRKNLCKKRGCGPLPSQPRSTNTCRPWATGLPLTRNANFPIIFTSIQALLSRAQSAFPEGRSSSEAGSWRTWTAKINWLQCSDMKSSTSLSSSAATGFSNFSPRSIFLLTSWSSSRLTAFCPGTDTTTN
jgi:hypothetical protein